MNEFTQDDINEILLEKPLDDFYFVILELRPEITDDALDRILKCENIRIDDENNRELEKYKKDIAGINVLYKKGKLTREQLKNMFSNMYREKLFSIITMIDGQLYDTYEGYFLNLDNITIFNYQNVTNYYNNATAKVILVPKEELGDGFENDVAAPCFRNLKYVIAYRDYYLNKEYDCDLTDELISELKSKKVNRIDLN